MTTYNTGNPIGSTDARDLSDNAHNLDLAVNSSESLWTDRLGNVRPTWNALAQYAGPAYDASTYGSLEAALDALGAGPATIQYATGQTFTANRVIPASIELMPLNGAVINHGAYTISYAGSTARWPLAQIIDGTGAVSGLKEARPEWFGTDAAAMTKAISSLTGGGGMVKLTTGSYNYGTAVINVPSNTTFSGTGKTSSLFTFTTGGFKIDNASAVRFENIGIRTAQGDTSGVKLVTLTGACRRVYFDNVYFEGGQYQIWGDNCYLVFIENCWFQSLGYLAGAGSNYGLYLDAIPAGFALSIHSSNSLYAGAHAYIDAQGASTASNITFTDDYFDSYEDAQITGVYWYGGGLKNCIFEQQNSGDRNIVFATNNVVGLDISGNLFHGNDNSTTCLSLDGRGHFLSGNYFYRASGGTAQITLAANSREVVIGPGNHDGAGSAATVSDLGARNTIFKLGRAGIMKAAGEFVTNANATITYDANHGQYIDFSASADGRGSVRVRMPGNIANGQGAGYRVYLTVYANAGAADSNTVKHYINWRVFSTGDDPGAAMTSIPADFAGLTSNISTVSATITMTAAQAAKEFLDIVLQRDGASGSDTNLQALRVHGLKIEWDELGYFQTAKN